MRLFKAVFAAGLLGVASHAAAQRTIPVPEVLTLSPGGVDVNSRTYNYTHNDIQIGDLSLVRIWRALITPQEASDATPAVAGFMHSLRIGVSQQRTPYDGWSQPGPNAQFNFLVKVLIGNTTHVFSREKSNTSPFETMGLEKGLSLTWTGTAPIRYYVFTDKADTQYVFLPTNGNFSAFAYVQSVTRADGYRMDFSYDQSDTRLRMVRDNKGNALAFEYSGTNISKVCAVNLAATAFTAGSSCPANAPAATYGYTSSTFTYTDPTSGTYTFTAESETTGTRTIALPGMGAPWLTLTMVANPYDYGMPVLVQRQDFADGTWWTYAQGSFTGPAGTTSFVFDNSVAYDTGTEGFQYIAATIPHSVQDPLGRTTYNCGAGGTPTSCNIYELVPAVHINPELDQVNFTYDLLDNPTQMTAKAKPSSGLADRVSSATYNVSQFGSRAKPTSVTDPRGYATLFSYDATHGGILTETQPADANGVQAVKRFAYSLHYAWSNTGSGFSQVTPGVWLLDTEKTCRTTSTSGNACVGGSADEVVTSYDYGPNTGAVGNNLLLRGVAVTADGQTRRTCYGYDALGNRIWETKPRAGLSACY